MMYAIYESMMQVIFGVTGWASNWVVGIPFTTALAAVALIGYLFGRSQVRRAQEDERREFEQAQQMIRQLQNVSQRIRRSLAHQHSSIQIFREKIQDLCEIQNEEIREQVAREAEKMLQPTAELSSDIVHTYEEIRSQTSQLDSIKKKRLEMKV